MHDDDDPVSVAMRETAQRRQQQENERSAGRSLDDAAGIAIDMALALAPEVVDAPTAESGERVIDIELASVSEANFVRKRVNAALSVAEWQPEVVVWVWQADTHKRAPLSEQGSVRGFELRLERGTS